jgi:hypothetical protein
MTIIEKKSVSVGEFLAGNLYRTGEAPAYDWNTEDVLDVIGSLAQRFLESFNPDHSPGEMCKHEVFCLGSVATCAEEGHTGETILNGHQFVTTVLLLLIYLHHHQNGRPGGVNLKRVIIFNRCGERLINPDVAEYRPALEALFHGSDFDLTAASRSARVIFGRYRDIEANFPEKIKDDFVPFFADWLLDKVTLEQTVALTQDGARILSLALACEKLSDHFGDEYSV